MMQQQPNMMGMNGMGGMTMNQMGMNMNMNMNQMNMNQMGMQNPVMMNGGNPMMTNGFGNPQPMMAVNSNFGGAGGMNGASPSNNNVNKNGNASGAMNSLDMNMSSMSAWTSGGGTK